jgi:hypothetical protein
MLESQQQQQQQQQQSNGHHPQQQDLTQQQQQQQQRRMWTKPPRVLSLEGLNPLVLGGQWLPDVKAAAGAVDASGQQPGDSPARITWQQVGVCVFVSSLASRICMCAQVTMLQSSIFSIDGVPKALSACCMAGSVEPVRQQQATALHASPGSRWPCLSQDTTCQDCRCELASTMLLPCGFSFFLGAVFTCSSCYCTLLPQVQDFDPDVLLLTPCSPCLKVALLLLLLLLLSGVGL